MKKISGWLKNNWSEILKFVLYLAGAGAMDYTDAMPRLVNYYSSEEVVEQEVQDSTVVETDTVKIELDTLNTEQ